MKKRESYTTDVAVHNDRLEMVQVIDCPSHPLNLVAYEWSLVRKQDAVPIPLSSRQMYQDFWQGIA